MRITQKLLDDLTYNIIGCAIEVHKQLGPGLLESVYEKCFIHELNLRGFHTQSQQCVPLNYKDLSIEADLRYDVLVEDLVVVELKSIDGLLPIHEAVLLTYMQLLEKPKGVIINFVMIYNYRGIYKSLTILLLFRHPSLIHSLTCNFGFDILGFGILILIVLCTLSL